MTLQDKLKYARTIIPMLEGFYGSLVYNSKTEFVDYGTTAWTDGKTIKFNRDFAEGLTREEFAGVLLHEVLHIAYLHIPRMLSGGLDRTKWNYATDFVINWQIHQLIQRGQRNNRNDLALPSGVLLDEQYANMSAEQVYELLSDLPEDGGGTLDGDITTEAAEPEELERAASEWRAAVAQAANQARMQGSLPEGVEREIDDLLYPKIDWRDKLKVFVQAFPIDYDYMTRDRRFLQERFIVPSLNGERITGVVALDTSGSIGHEELKQFLSEVHAILESFGRVDLWAVSCDAAVHNPQALSSRQDVYDYTPKGGGGTDFRPVFAWVQEHLPQADFVVYFTDGYGEFGDDPGKPVLWVMTTDLRAPYGETVKL